MIEIIVVITVFVLSVFFFNILSLTEVAKGGKEDIACFTITLECCFDN